jgi:alkaline phosphatase D
MKIQRRKLLKSFGAFTLAAPALTALSVCSPRIGQASEVECQNTPTSPPVESDQLPHPCVGPEQPQPPSLDFSNGAVFKPGYLSIVQGPTSDTTTTINMFVPKLKKYIFEVVDTANNSYRVENYFRLEGPNHWHVVKLRVSGLTPGVQYTLSVFDSGKSKQLIDRRSFSSLDISKSTPRFGFLSCMADDFRFDDIIDPMWNRLKDQNVDFLFLSGDLVYVDSFETVERDKASEFDIWQRYVDGLKRIPVYHWSNLKPIFATWDDHDYGTNDGDRDFVGRSSADKLFHALFFGDEIDNIWTLGPKGTSGLFKAFGQKFFLMDDRSFRQPNKNQAIKEPYGHWGEEQHHWLMKNLGEDKTPAWIFNGNQFFRGAPDKVTFVESLQYNHPAEFKNFCEGLKKISAPVVFASGDVHLSELMKISPEMIGYQSYEITSSSMHSFIGGNTWENSLRIPNMVTSEFNFMVIQSKAVDKGGQTGIKIDLQSLGMVQRPYFQSSLEIFR